MMHGHEKSDLAIVAEKPVNKAEQPAPERSAAKLNAAEPVERRAGTKGNAGQQSTCRTQSRANVSQALERIRKMGMLAFTPAQADPAVPYCRRAPQFHSSRHIPSRRSTPSGSSYWFRRHNTTSLTPVG
jgi:hypothetical protein